MARERTFEVRNIRFATDEYVPRHWHGGQISVTSFFNNLSVFFPAGERFFVASVNRHRDLAGDDRLREDVEAFCGQEGIHSREHVRYNRMLARQGYPVEAMEVRVEHLLRFVTRVVPHRRRLAVTCALEHFTATLGHTVLSDARILEGAHPEMAALWMWHSVEENEHKAVAYDLYMRAGGNYPERVLAMVLATVIFWAFVLLQQAELMKADGVLFSPREWFSLLGYLFIRPGIMRKHWIVYFDYYRPGFHPWLLDNRDLVEKCRQGFARWPSYGRVT